MNKESGACSNLDALSIHCHNTSPLPSLAVISPLTVRDMENLTPISAMMRTHDEGEKNVAEQKGSTEKHQHTEHSDSRAMDVEAAQGIGRYEYMYIRRSDSTEEEQKRHSKSTEETEESDRTVEVLMKEHKEEQEVEKHRNTNKQLLLQGDPSNVSMHVPDVLKAGGEKLEEYEEMTRPGVVHSGWEPVDYQNLPMKGRTVPVETDSGRCAEIREYIKVCAGVGEAGSNISFDNPDYWHSRMFLQPDAVRS